MKSLTTTISESLDEVSPAHAQSWNQILARAQFEPASPRKSHKRMAVLVAAVGFGLIGGTVMTAASNSDGLPSTDFDVALAPNIAAMTEPRPMSAEDIAAYREQHNSDPIKAVVFCQIAMDYCIKSYWKFRPNLAPRDGILTLILGQDDLRKFAAA